MAAVQDYNDLLRFIIALLTIKLIENRLYFIKENICYARNISKFYIILQETSIIPTAEKQKGSH